MLANRFDNLSTAQLRELDNETREEAKAIEAALIARLEAACSVEVDGVYKVKVGLIAPGIWTKLSGRIVKVASSQAWRVYRPDEGGDIVKAMASVRPKLVGSRNTPTSDGFGRKHH